MSHHEYVDPVLAESLRRHLPPAMAQVSDWRLLPDGTTILVGTEHIWSVAKERPKPVTVDVGGDRALLLWREGTMPRS